MGRVSASTRDDDNGVLVEVRNLVKTFVSGDTLVRRLLGQNPEVLRAVDNVSLRVYRGETLGLVGESGCGKTTLGRCIVRLYEPDEGEVFYEGENVLELQGTELRGMRQRMQMVFQDPYSSLNPRMTVRQALSEALRVHEDGPQSEVEEKVTALALRVGLPAAALDRVPKQFSGGQRQRIGIARALAVEPEFIVADEPVSSLDVSVQAQVINLLMSLQEELEMTMIMIAHDLSLVRHVSRRVAVMYLGRIVEIAPRDELFDTPFHPYTSALLSAVPRVKAGQTPGKSAVEGEPPSPINLPRGCRFHPRCRRAAEVCMLEEPDLVEVENGHYVACHMGY